MTTLSPAPPRATVARPLGARWIDLLRDGNDGDYASDYRAVAAVALAMVRAGHTFADFERELTDPSNRLAAQYRLKDCGRRTRNNRGLYRKLVKDWNAALACAVNKPQVHDRVEALQYLGVIQAAMFLLAWSGAGGRRDKLVLAALIAIGVNLGTVRPAVGLRALETATNLSRETVRRALQSLAAKGWLQISSEQDPRLPHVYRLLDPTASDGNCPAVQKWDTSLPLPRVGSGGSVLDAPVVARDPDRQLVLVCGTAAAAVEAALSQDHALTVAQITGLAAVCRQTAYTWLRRLAAMGLAVLKEGLGWLRTGKAVQEEVGGEVVVKEAQRAQRHAVERANWHYRLLHLPRTFLQRRGRARLEGVARGFGRLETEKEGGAARAGRGGDARHARMGPAAWPAGTRAAERGIRRGGGAFA